MKKVSIKSQSVLSVLLLVGKYNRFVFLNCKSLNFKETPKSLFNIRQALQPYSLSAGSHSSIGQTLINATPHQTHKRGLCPTTFGLVTCSVRWDCARRSVGTRRIFTQRDGSRFRAAEYLRYCFMLGFHSTSLLERDGHPNSDICSQQRAAVALAAAGGFAWLFKASAKCKLTEGSPPN